MKALDEHIKLFHNYKCEFCDDSNETLKTKAALENHIKLHHHQLKCDICNADDFKTKNDLDEHVILEHKCAFCDVGDIKTQNDLEEHRR